MIGHHLPHTGISIGKKVTMHCLICTSLNIQISSPPPPPPPPPPSTESPEIAVAAEHERYHTLYIRSLAKLTLSENLVINSSPHFIHVYHCCCPLNNVCFWMYAIFDLRWPSPQDHCINVIW